jgi:hypothetical protein
MQERGLIVICDCTHLTIRNEYVQCQSIEEVATSSYGSPFQLVGVSFLCITRVSRGATEDGRTKIVSIKSSYPIPIQFQRGVTPVTLGTATRTLTTYDKRTDGAGSVACCLQNNYRKVAVSKDLWLSCVSSLSSSANCKFLPRERGGGQTEGEEFGFGFQQQFLIPYSSVCL